MLPTTLNSSEHKKVSGLPPESALPLAAACLARLVRDPDFLESEITSLLEQTTPTADSYVARRLGDPDGTCSLQIFVWPPGTGTRIHDHACWGAFCCVSGSLIEERYERLDDGSLPDVARVNKSWQLAWTREDGVSTLLPYEGGIHRVVNPGRETAISVHLYGPRLGDLDGRDYDPSKDFVCGRRQD